MIRLFWKPYRLFIFLLLIFGVLLSLSAENWLAIWMGLEINLYRFIPLILIRGNNQEKEAAVKYFISQSIPSALVVVSFINYFRSSNISSLLFFVAILIKLGIAPLHYWITSVIGSISWVICWMLSTIQKIAPMILIFYGVLCPSVIVAYSAGLSSIVGGVGGLNQTIFRTLLAYSSIGHIGWMIGASLGCKTRALFYLFRYITIISGLFLFIDFAKIRSGNFSLKLRRFNWITIIVVLIFFRLGGLPPFFGFYAKIIVLVNLREERFFLLSFFLILGSVLNLYYYLKIVFILILRKPRRLFRIIGRFSRVWAIVLRFFLVLSIIGLVIIISLF